MQAYSPSPVSTRAIPPILKHTSSNRLRSQNPDDRSRNLQHTIHYPSPRRHHPAQLGHRNENEHIEADWKRRCVSNAIEGTAYFRTSLYSAMAATRRGINGVMIPSSRQKLPLYLKRSGSAVCVHMRGKWQDAHLSSAWAVRWLG